MPSLSNLVNKFFTSVAVYFPKYVYVNHSEQNDEESLIKQSEEEGIKFSNKFRDEYGENCNQFYATSCIDAITLSTVQHKPLLVYLTSSLHDYFSKFNKVLASEQVVDTLRNDYVCWGCDATSNYGYSLLTSIKYPITELPIILIMLKKDENAPLLLLGSVNYQKGMTPDLFLSQINMAIAQAMQMVRQEELDRQTQEQNRQLEAQQRREYEEALEADRMMMEHQNQKNSDIEEVNDEKTEAEIKAERMNKIRESAPDEPTTGDIVRLRVIYPNGTKLQRNFNASDKASLLLDLIELDIYDNNISIDSFELCSSPPKVNITSNDREMTLSDLGIKGSCVLRVKPI